MASLRIITCIPSAIENLQSNKKIYLDWFRKRKLRGGIYSSRLFTSIPSEEAGYDIMMYKLRSLRTFILCSALMGNHVQLRTQDTLTLGSRENTLKKKKKKMNKLLGCFLVQAEDLLSRIMEEDYAFPYKLKLVLCEVERLEKEMDEFYTRLSRYLQQYSTSPVADEAIDITESILDHLHGFLSSDVSRDLVGPAQTLKEKITTKRNFIRFATLFCTDEHQQFKDLLTSIEAVAVSAGHLTLHLLPRKDGYSDMAESMISGLLVRIKNADYPLLHETYLQALDLSCTGTGTGT